MARRWSVSGLPVRLPRGCWPWRGWRKNRGWMGWWRRRTRFGRFAKRADLIFWWWCPGYGQRIPQVTISHASRLQRTRFGLARTIWLLDGRSLPRPIRARRRCKSLRKSQPLGRATRWIVVRARFVFQTHSCTKVSRHEPWAFSGHLTQLKRFEPFGIRFEQRKYVRWQP